MFRARWRALTRNALLFVLGTCAVSALLEHILERRDASRLTAHETFYTAGGRRIRYHLTGASSPGPTVVLLTGLAASLEQWDRVQSALGTASPVLSYDRTGTGFSDPVDGYDANAQAEELNQLLQSRLFRKPVVLVCYSSSSMLAIVFGARHRDMVKGIVLVDPTAPLLVPGRETYRRMLLRPSVINPLQAFFGYTRLKQAIEGRDAPPPSPVLQRSKAILVSTHHWLAAARDSMSLDASAYEADAVMASHPFADIPISVLSTAEPENKNDPTFGRHQALASSSHFGFMRSIRADHSQVLNDPVTVGFIVDMIRRVIGETRHLSSVRSPAPRAVHGTDKWSPG